MAYNKAVMTNLGQFMTTCNMSFIHMSTELSPYLQIMAQFQDSLFWKVSDVQCEVYVLYKMRFLWGN